MTKKLMQERKFFKKNNYWNHSGTYETLYKKLSKLIPSEGSVTTPKSSKLEKLRKAANTYHDIFNNGACNSTSQVNSYFGFKMFEFKSWSNYNFDSMYVLTEPAMDKYILDAALEQFPIEKINKWISKDISKRVK